MKHSNMTNFGAKLRKRRKRLGMTLDDLATRTGISKPYLSLIETAHVPNPPTIEKLRNLECALSFDIGELQMEAGLLRTPKIVLANMTITGQQPMTASTSVIGEVEALLDDLDVGRLDLMRKRLEGLLENLRATSVDASVPAA